MLWNASGSRPPSLATMSVGARFPLEGESVRPGNLRTVAVTLNAAVRRVAPGALSVVAALVVDGEDMELRAREGQARVSYGAAENPDLILKTDYGSLLALSEGEMPEQEFLTVHCQVELLTPGKDDELLQLMRMILGVLHTG
ncbi:hypothetical protein AIOL_003063 [Candidatus Rhodobacter oscarellae]|uniref:Uncharacterized protein n=2 Tax=Candidatus Rhodobacter oscarellae TaxID=1675527 RepID=A0A0J9E5S5_9RHOB|nr:hypothetical protein AIOL_003063 [Candidatus Rhodobacter lobularis]